MPVNQVDVHPLPSRSLPDNMGPVNQIGGSSGEALQANLHGDYFTQTYRGRAWHASNAVGSPVAVPLMVTNASPTFAIFNPAGSGVAAVLKRITFGWTAGTGIAGCIGYAYLYPAGTAMVGTAAPISTFTAGPAIQSGVCGVAYAGPIQFVIAATIGGAKYTATLHKWSGIGQGAPITSTADMWTNYEDFDGTVIVPPNCAWFPVASVAIAETFQISLSAYDIPWPG